MLKYQLSTLAISMVSFAICMFVVATYSCYREETFINSIYDVKLPIFEKLPHKIIQRTRIGISLDEDDLNIFKTAKEMVTEEVQEEVEEEEGESPDLLIDGSIGYFVDSDLPFIKRLSKLYQINFTPVKLANLREIDNYSLLFLRSRVDDSLYQTLSDEYQLLELDKDRKKYLNYYLPFSNLKTTVDNVSKKIINIVKIPNIILNPQTLAINAEASKTLNIHLGKRHFMQPFNMSTKIKLEGNKKKNSHECVNADDMTTITDYKTKASCESPFDIFGEMKKYKMKWHKRCDDDFECKYHVKDKNRRRGVCNDGICEEPLFSAQSKPLHYGTDEKDYAFENDLQDRLVLNLQPLLNL